MKLITDYDYNVFNYDYVSSGNDDYNHVIDYN